MNHMYLTQYGSKMNQGGDEESHRYPSNTHPILFVNML